MSLIQAKRAVFRRMLLVAATLAFGFGSGAAMSEGDDEVDLESVEAMGASEGTSAINAIGAAESVAVAEASGPGADTGRAETVDVTINVTGIKKLDRKSYVNVTMLPENNAIKTHVKVPKANFSNCGTSSGNCGEATATFKKVTMHELYEIRICQKKSVDPECSSNADHASKEIFTENNAVFSFNLNQHN